MEIWDRIVITDLKARSALKPSGPWYSRRTTTVITDLKARSALKLVKELRKIVSINVITDLKARSALKHFRQRLTAFATASDHRPESTKCIETILARFEERV